MMGKFSAPPLFAGLLIFAAGPVSESARTELPSGNPDIYGVITQISRSTALGENLGVILVEEKPGESAGSQKALATITTRTRILKKEDGQLSELSFDDLAHGERVQVWFTGPVAESYPVQAAARFVLLVPKWELDFR